MLSTAVMDYTSFALVTACVVAAVIGVLSVLLIAFFCYMEAEDVPTETHEHEIMSRYEPFPPHLTKSVAKIPPLMLSGAKIPPLMLSGAKIPSLMLSGAKMPFKWLDKSQFYVVYFFEVEKGMNWAAYP